MCCNYTHTLFSIWENVTVSLFFLWMSCSVLRKNEKLCFVGFSHFWGREADKKRPYRHICHLPLCQPAGCSYPSPTFQSVNYQPQEVAQLGKVYEVKQLCMGGLPAFLEPEKFLATLSSCLTRSLSDPQAVLLFFCNAPQVAERYLKVNFFSLPFTDFTLCPELPILYVYVRFIYLYMYI